MLARPPRTDATEANRRLTGSTAAVLLVLLAVEGVTILAIRPLLPVHVFVGMLLVPPVLLKLASTGWRFLRYYRGDRAYVLAGPPPVLLRLLGPLVVAATVGLFGTGVLLVVVGPRGGIVLGLHKASFVVWFFATAVHVLGHVLKVPRLAAADWRRGERLAGTLGRRALVAGSIVLGLTLALATYPAAAPWFR